MAPSLHLQMQACTVQQPNQTPCAACIYACAHPNTSLKDLNMNITNKETHENNLVQTKGNNANEMDFNLCLFLVQITTWLGMA
jgi:hypothetical protein